MNYKKHLFNKNLCLVSGNMTDLDIGTIEFFWVYLLAGQYTEESHYHIVTN
jgi:hypothetical protein